MFIVSDSPESLTFTVTVDERRFASLGNVPDDPIETAEAFRAETGQQDLATMSSTIRRVFPDAVAEYARLGRSIHRVLMEHQAAESKPSRAVKVGRNEPCPCGSGPKYKMCCGAGRA